MAQALLKEQEQLLKALSDPKLVILLRELAKHIQYQAHQDQLDKGCG